MHVLDHFTVAFGGSVRRLVLWHARIALAVPVVQLSDCVMAQ